ncbi:MAG: TrkA family potassium uptake protein [Clostridia bacterium]|nr:TrkA family potassium uptake protein [Clostridia bacterium]MBR2663833.1 TrkA family potassium uptake protein [Clostridia bacterium]
MKSYVVIGLGRFGAEIAVRLYACGEEVLAVDVDEQIVDKIADQVTRAVAADARDRDVLEKLGVGNFDRAVVAVGSDLAASALITMNLKALGISYIVCKAHDDTYREILEKLGADRVIIPEWEAADKLALGMTHAGVMEYIELSEEFGIMEVEPQDGWIGKTIRTLELRSRYGANVIALRQGEKISIPPDIDAPLDRECALVILGRYEALEKMKR